MLNPLWESVGAPCVKTVVDCMFYDSVCFFIEDLAYCSATGDIVGFVDFGDAELASLTAANDSVATHVLAVFMRGIVFHHLGFRYFIV